MAKYIAEIQDASGNTVYPATQWGAITNPPDINNIVKVSDWVNLTMRNGFDGTAQIRTTKYLSGQTKVDIYMEANHLRSNTGKYMCDFPAELLPKRELPLMWYQPNNVDYDRIGASVGSAKKSINLNYAIGGSGDLVVIFNLSYWLDV
ncbi:hypothetical protein LCW_07770 [Latilactobacillus curvatus]|uniref:hypothetical protein n=1 Tax=Latilactobacillus curvatus TaxID=28038 RepID=UPI00084A1BEC|nr:hypothetical protein [Latilactobacillus curvatus]AOO75955.1 hypothetical protein LCW_07770 [Latilactobacillus curvatus]